VRVVLPVRGIGRGKSRLAAALDAAERSRLNRLLLLNTLRVLDRWLGGLQRCVVVSPCPRTLRLAQRAGAVAQAQPRPCAGLNPAIAHAVGALVRAGRSRVLVLPCDLPLLSTAALTRFCSSSPAGVRMVIAPDRAGTGTNALLLLHASARFAFSFGPDSFVLHKDAARARGWAFHVCEAPELAFDLDTPRDLAAWGAAKRTAARITRVV